MVQTSSIDFLEVDLLHRKASEQRLQRQLSSESDISHPLVYDRASWASENSQVVFHCNLENSCWYFCSVFVDRRGWVGEVVVCLTKSICIYVLHTSTLTRAGQGVTPRRSGSKSYAASLRSLFKSQPDRLSGPSGNEQSTFPEATLTLAPEVQYFEMHICEQRYRVVLFVIHVNSFRRS